MATLSTFRAQLSSGLRAALPVWLAARLTALGLAFVLWQLGLVPVDALASPAPNSPGYRPFEGPVSGWTLGVWQRFDTLRYLEIASDGYRPASGNSVFPPLYPMLIRALTPLFFGESLAAALAIAGLAFLAALVLLYALIVPELGEDAARRSLWLLGFFPSAYYLQAGYTESLYLALAIGAFLAARRGRWWLAGLLGMLGALARVQGVVVAIPLAFEYARQARWSPRALLARPALAAGLVPAGLLGFWAWQRSAGLPLFTEAAERLWGSLAAPPWATVAAALDLARSGQAAPGRLIALAAFGLLAVLTALAAWPYLVRGRRPVLPAAWVVYLAALLLLLLLRHDPSRPLLSMPRHALMAFPALVLLAHAGGRPWCWRLILYPSMMLYMLFQGMFFMGGYLE